jgi:hypothetical protein
MIQVREYIDDAGRNHFGAWRARLDPTTRARIDVLWIAWNAATHRP